MKKSILNLGKALNKAEQKSINGGWDPCRTTAECQEMSGDPYAICWNKQCILS